MADKTPAEKLFLKPGMCAAILDLPESIPLASLGMPDDVTLAVSPARADFVLEFASTQAEAERRIRDLAPDISATSVAWIAYPKGSKTAGLDVSRDTIADFVRTIGLVAIANFSIDATWSALRIRPLEPGE